MNRLGIGNDAHSIKSHTPLSIKSEHSSNANHTRSPSIGTLPPNNSNNNNNNNNNNNANNNLCGTTSLTCMPSATSYAVNSTNLSAPPPLAGHFNHPNPLLYHQYHNPNDWYHGAVPPPPNDINHFNHLSHQHLMHHAHATAY